MKTAVIYARFSCSKQREASIEDQLRVCMEWCQREGYAVVGTYSDRAISGRTDDRPSFQQMISNAGESDIVLVYMMDRFSRSEYDAPVYKHELAKRGVRLISAMESIPDSPEGIIYEKLLEGLAACESMKTSVRTKRGMEGNARKCMHNGVRVFGYSVGPDGRYVVNEDEAAIVREVFERRLQGESCNSIATDLARRGIKTYAGNPAGYSFVHNMCRNEKYIGTYKFGSYREEHGMPSIIDPDTFARVQKVRGRKQRADETWDEYPLSGKAVCSVCGRNLEGNSGRNHDGVKYRYYRCKDGCTKPVRADWLEGELVSLLRCMLGDREQALGIAEQVAASVKDVDYEARTRQAKKAIKDAETGLANILKAIEAGVLAPGTKERIEELEEQKAKGELDLKLLEQAVDVDVEDFADFLQFGATLDDKTLLEAFIWQVQLGEDEALAILNYDIKERPEPATVRVKRVRANAVWLPAPSSPRTSYACIDGMVIIRIPR